ncbi:MAG: tRNA (5-methylaminomethyl-2-thiouridine)(34)-methyltransferase MnmD [Parafilimonas sp.]|nr:tRNA (5-methylaminomethyl-2-thiouridine)(34)-methyltransferase MnmD [Parafilimonas sp.]
MNKKVLHITEDGSHTIADEALNVTYHSKHGAIQESRHVFINAGLNYFLQQHLNNKQVCVFEMGFGTGLNALLTLQQAIQLNQKIIYQTIEPYPLSAEAYLRLNYASLIDNELQQNFTAMHTCEWNKPVSIHPLFSLQKIITTLQQFITAQQFDVIYFDAFDPNAQPELWTIEIFKKMFDHMLHSNGVLTTYCSKGIVRRALQFVGFTVEKLKGPKGKREIVRAVKTLI